MTRIRDIQRTLRDGSLVIGTPEVNSLRKYFNNARRVNRAPITELGQQLKKRGPHLLEANFRLDSIEWFRKLLLRKNGAPRATDMARRLSPSQIEVVQNLSGFYLIEMFVDADDDYETDRFPCHEKYRSYPVWRATSDHGDWFDYYHVPWQESTDPADTGLFVVRASGNAS